MHGSLYLPIEIFWRRRKYTHKIWINIQSSLNGRIYVNKIDLTFPLVRIRVRIRFGFVVSLRVRSIYFIASFVRAEEIFICILLAYAAQAIVRFALWWRWFNGGQRKMELRWRCLIRPSSHFHFMHKIAEYIFRMRNESLRENREMNNEKQKLRIGEKLVTASAVVCD